MKSELSEKNQYYINKYRYYELKYYCLQYPAWKKALNSIDAVVHSTSLIKPKKEKDNYSLVEKCAIAKVFYMDKMKPIEDAAIEADEELSRYILKRSYGGVVVRHYECKRADPLLPRYLL